MSETTKVTTDTDVNEASEPNSLAFSIVMFTVMFLLFAGGLYVMSLYTIEPILFMVGLGMSILSLFIAFDIIPRFFTK
ncbi:MAG: hypothetical protein Q4G21_00555 [Dermabacter sp.]|nr:hypothetical protein [Dermabacter sp.]